MARYCVDCDNVHADTRQKEPWRQRCVKWPITAWGGSVDPAYKPDPPYEKCENINRHANCPMWEPRRDNGENDG